MKTKTAALALLALSALPLRADKPPVTFDDWEKKVRAGVADAERAGRVVEAGRAYDERRKAFGAAAVRADAALFAVFARYRGEEGERLRALQEARDARRKAAVAAVDAYLDVRGLLEKKEWGSLSPREIAYGAPAAPGLAKKAQAEVPKVVAEPRRQAAEAAAKELVSGVEKAESARRLARRRLESFLKEYSGDRDRVLEILTELEEALVKADDAIDQGTARLQAATSAEEWAELVKRIAPAK